tara:strand:- start:66755 stop:67084 length:330 start_codon:yes stop_codon:yes gene_type:complete
MFLVNILSKTTGQTRQVSSCDDMQIPNREEFEIAAVIEREEAELEMLNSETPDKEVSETRLESLLRKNTTCDYFMIITRKDSETVIPLNSSKYSVYAMSDQGKTIAKFE